jgi:hypothetical protein
MNRASACLLTAHFFPVLIERFLRFGSLGSFTATASLKGGFLMTLLRNMFNGEQERRFASDSLAVSVLQDATLVVIVLLDYLRELLARWWKKRETSHRFALAVGSS